MSVRQACNLKKTNRQPQAAGDLSSSSRRRNQATLNLFNSSCCQDAAIFIWLDACCTWTSSALDLKTAGCVSNRSGLMMTWDFTLLGEWGGHLVIVWFDVRWSIDEPTRMHTYVEIHTSARFLTERPVVHKRALFYISEAKVTRRARTRKFLTNEHNYQAEWGANTPPLITSMLSGFCVLVLSMLSMPPARTH